MSSSQADLSAYPVIRIDHIPLVLSNVLRDSISEVEDLIASMNADEGPKPPLLFYLRRQLEAMHGELATRNANDRINSLLAGVNLNDSYNFNTKHQQGEKKASTAPKIDRPTEHSATPAIAPRSVPRSAPKQLQSPTVSDIKAKVTVNELPPKPVYKRIPLPSELAWESSSKETTLKESSSRVTKIDEMSASTSSSTCLSSSASSGNREKGGKEYSSREEKEEEDTSIPITSRSEGNIGIGFSNTLGEEREDGEGDSHSMHSGVARNKRVPNNTARALKASRRSNSMTNNDPSVGSPSSKAQAALYKDFGSSFLVAGTEKKLRFYPKKVIVETVEDVRDRDRTDRFVLHWVDYDYS